MFRIIFFFSLLSVTTACETGSAQSSPSEPPNRKPVTYDFAVDCERAGFQCAGTVVFKYPAKSCTGDLCGFIYQSEWLMVPLRTNFNVLVVESPEKEDRSRIRKKIPYGLSGAVVRKIHGDKIGEVTGEIAWPGPEGPIEMEFHRAPVLLMRDVELPRSSNDCKCE